MTSPVSNKRQNINVSRRFLLKLIIFFLFAGTQSQPRASTTFFLMLLSSIAASVLFAIFIRASVFKPHLGYWDEALAFTMLAILTYFIIN